MAGRKKRVRQHIIADMSFHHVAYRIVKHGFTIEAVSSDYGYDGSIVTFNSKGEVENGVIYIQLKATDKIKKGKTAHSAEFRVDKRDLAYWGDEPFPVYFILFDAKSERAYWIYFQKFVQAKKLSAAKMKTKTFAITIDTRQQVDEQTAKAWRAEKSAVLTQIGAVDHV
jgi:hypothetical protein